MSAAQAPVFCSECNKVINLDSLGSVYVVANTGNETEYYHLQCFEGWKGKRTWRCWNCDLDNPHNESFHIYSKGQRFSILHSIHCMFHESELQLIQDGAYTTIAVLMHIHIHWRVPIIFWQVRNTKNVYVLYNTSFLKKNIIVWNTINIRYNLN